MKKVILLFLITAVMFSCKKNENVTPDVKYQDVSFNVTTLVPDADRGLIYDGGVPECRNDFMPTYAVFDIERYDPDFDNGDGTFGKYVFYDTYTVPVFYIDQNGNVEGIELYTQAIKLPIEDCVTTGVDCCETYQLTSFQLWHETLGAGADSLVKAIPAAGSTFDEFVDIHLPIPVVVCAFEKVEIPIEVLCFEPHYYDLFGFFWFNITEITVREMCFFGDICMPFWFPDFVETDWTTTPFNYYANQAAGVQMIMPAIFRIEIFRNDVYQRTYDNLDYDAGDPPVPNGWWGEGAPLCVRYADYDAMEDLFRFDLYVYGPWDFATFSWSLQGSWTFNDMIDGMDTNGDGVIDWALLNCDEDPEYVMPGNYGIN